MAAVRFKMSVDQTGQIAPPILTNAQLMVIGQAMVARQKQRWSRAINAMDGTAKPLSAVTAKGKLSFGKKPIRDMNMTGLMTANFTLRKATANEIRAENTSRAGRMHARKAQAFEKMIGISPSDRDYLFGLAYRAYGVYLQRAWRPSNG